MIITKSFNDLTEYAECHPVLLNVLRYIDDFMVHNIGQNPVITEIKRTEKEQIRYYPDQPNRISLHQLTPVRAIDLRTNTLSIDQIELLEEAINSNWDYGYPPLRVCIYHKVDNNVYHFHIQVSDKTKIKNLNR